jgi:hypothetical protein
MTIGISIIIGKISIATERRRFGSVDRALRVIWNAGELLGIEVGTLGGVSSEGEFFSLCERFFLFLFTLALASALFAFGL